MTDTAFTAPGAAFGPGDVDDLDTTHNPLPGREDTTTGADDGMSSLDLLRDATAEQFEFEPYVFTNRTGVVRVTCDPNIDPRERQRWEKASMPQQKGRRRRGSAPDPTDMDSFGLFCRVVIGATEQIEVKRPDGSWVPVRNSAGDLVTFEDPEFQRKLGAMDAASALKRVVLGVNNDIINAAIDLLEWTDREDDVDPSDPTR